ncbi:MAG: thiamine diphosphokinase [Anaerolineae bacterium]
MTHALIFANGDLNRGAMVRRALDAARVPERRTLMVAADGGARMALSLGLRPHVVIGDMDSLTVDELAPLEAAGVEVLRYPPEKNETDLELALMLVVERGAKWIRIIGAVGDRLDQTMANVYLMALPLLAGVDARMVAGKQEMWLLPLGNIRSMVWQAIRFRCCPSAATCAVFPPRACTTRCIMKRWCSARARRQQRHEWGKGQSGKWHAVRAYHWAGVNFQRYPLYEADDQNAKQAIRYSSSIPLSVRVLSNGARVPVPYHIYDGSLLFIGGTAALNAVSTLLQSESVTPIQTSDGKALMAVWACDFREASLGAHQELQFSLFVSRTPQVVVRPHPFTILDASAFNPVVRMLCHGL